ncbi:MAG: site-specific DNA-methyltransferase [Halobacteriovoraceae bacterium]|nr:site-specific DNA-methyltransferase [Halobacteriovoraceae bacterium]
MNPKNLFSLGENTHIQGDSTLKKPYSQVLGENRVKLILADPPYCLLTRRRKDGRLRDPKKAKIEHEAVRRFENGKEYTAFTLAWMEKAAPYLDESGHFIIWTNFLGKAPIMKVAESLDLFFHGEYTWAKWSKGGSGNERLARAYEVALIFSKSPNKDLKDTDYCPPRFCINNYDEEQEGLKWGNHPNHKSFSVLEPLIRFYTAPGERVLDPFTGSGSTPAACMELNRLIAGIELRPKWAEMTQSRLKSFQE